ncbi:hypothetical protein GCM10025865_16080 [Paraoerskovia sediminicola]|uniref:TM2 domain-containing protein n=1 Tax=Paraoerskovia sediminicola TaxID=1138587 RepID=A0ABN6XC00_9CELL|nr:NINE protein [Paraoerskovia sediminicola]BDZ42309.1 hypothetical protein GCM10025865_16080 [Paraoerskovia sediminicola]
MTSTPGAPHPEEHPTEPLPGGAGVEDTSTRPLKLPYPSRPPSSDAADPPPYGSPVTTYDAAGGPVGYGAGHGGASSYADAAGPSASGQYGQYGQAGQHGQSGQAGPYGPAQHNGPAHPYAHSPYAQGPYGVTTPIGVDPYGRPVYAPVVAQKSRVATLLFALFLGGLGIHRFYLGFSGVGVAWLLVALLVGPFMFLIPNLLLSVWAVVEGILFATARSGYFSVDRRGIPLR